MIILGPHVAQLKTQKISISHKHKSIHSNASYNVPGITKVDQSFSQPLSHKVISKVSTRDYNIFAGWAAGKARTLVIKRFFTYICFNVLLIFVSIRIIIFLLGGPLARLAYW